METKANYVAVGSFVLACVIGLMISILWLANKQFNQEFSYIQTYFDGPVTGLNKDSVTRYNGIDVGRVTEMDFDPKNPQRVIVTLQVRPGLHIRIDSRASVESQGLTGGSYVEISGGTAGKPELPDTDRQPYPLIKSDRSTLQQLAQSAPRLVNQLNVAVDNINKVLDDQNRAQFAAILVNLNKTTTAVATHSADIEATLHSANLTMANLRDASGQIKPMLGDADVSVKKIGKLADDTDAFINGEGLSQVSDLISELRRLTGNLTKFSDQLNREPTKLLFGDRRKGYEPKGGTK